MKNIDYILHIGGDGKLIEYYKNLASQLSILERCIFYGTINPEKTPNFFSKLDLFVLPSDYETFGVVIIEAMAIGIPVIATRCGGPEYIISEDMGLLIEKNSVEQLTRSIEYIYYNYDKYNQKNIREYVISHYSYDVIGNKLKILYKTLKGV